MNGRDRQGVAASAFSVAELPYEQARDGISLTMTITPGSWCSAERTTRGPWRAWPNLVAGPGSVDRFDVHRDAHPNGP